LIRARLPPTPDFPFRRRARTAKGVRAALGAVVHGLVPERRAALAAAVAVVRPRPVRIERAHCRACVGPRGRSEKDTRKLQICHTLPDIEPISGEFFERLYYSSLRSTA
jgi:hypothetical protein